MKKIISMLALAISAFAIVACSDDDNVGSQYQKKSNIVITASNLNFSAKADTGSVTFTAPEAATVRLNSAWATAVLEGNKVKVTVKENNNVEGRATQLTILSGTDSANVTIQQLGMNYEYNGHHLFIYNDEAHAVSYPVVNEGANITLSSSADWAVPTLNNNQVGLFFKGRPTNINTNFGFNTATNQANAIAIATQNGNDVLTIANYTSTDIFEQYYLLHTAYAVVPTVSLNPDGTRGTDLDLWLHYNYRPWAGQNYNNNGTSRDLLARNVTRFNFTEDNGVIVIKLCIRDAGRSLGPTRAETTVCKTKAVY